MWQHWVNFILGLWIMLSAFLGFGAADMVTNLVIVGLVIAVLAIWGALEEQAFHKHGHA